MAVKMILPEHITVEKFYVMKFYEGSAYLPTHEYPCDKEGNIIFDDDANLWIEKYLEMEGKGTRKELDFHTHETVQPAYVECDCGNRFFLKAKRGRTCMCQGCGKMYDIYVAELVGNSNFVGTSAGRKGVMTA